MAILGNGAFAVENAADLSSGYLLRTVLRAIDRDIDSYIYMYIHAYIYVERGIHM